MSEECVNYDGKCCQISSVAYKARGSVFIISHGCYMQS